MQKNWFYWVSDKQTKKICNIWVYLNEYVTTPFGLDCTDVKHSPSVSHVDCGQLSQWHFNRATKMLKKNKQKHNQFWYVMKTEYNLVFCFESVLQLFKHCKPKFHLLFGSVKGREWAPILSSLWWKAYAWLWFMLLKLLFTLLIVSFLVLLLGDCFIVKLFSFSLSTSRG